MKRANLVRGRDGFTLIELLMVVALMGILASLAAPRMNRYVEQTKTRRALDQISTDLSQARLMAVERSQRTWVTIGANGNYTLDTLATNGVDRIPFKSVNLSSDIRGLSVVAGSANEFEFSSRGMVVNYGQDSEGGILTLTAGSARDSLFVSPSGRVYRGF